MHVRGRNGRRFGAVTQEPQYLGFGISVALPEGAWEKVRKRDFAAPLDRMLADPVPRRFAPAFVVRCKTPELLWGYLRSKATGSGSWHVRRSAMHEAIDPVLEALRNLGCR